jgi:hypothetical protein
MNGYSNLENHYYNPHVVKIFEAEAQCIHRTSCRANITSCDTAGAIAPHGNMAFHADPPVIADRTSVAGVIE